MPQIAKWMRQAVDARDEPDTLEVLHVEVKAFALQYPLPSDN
jgi:hypothetical protein